MLPAVVEEICAITAKGQTTVLKAGDRALGIGYNELAALLPKKRRVTIHALSENENTDLVSTLFLAFLEADLVV